MSSITIPFSHIVQLSDPNRERDLAREPQYEFTRKTFYGDTRRTGIYSPRAPAFVRNPVISRAAVVGNVLRCIVTRDMVRGAPEPSITYQWLVGGVELDGETDLFLATQSVDEGETFTCAVTLTNVSGSVTVTTPPVTLAANFDFELADDTISDAADIGDLVGTFRPISG